MAATYEMMFVPPRSRQVALDGATDFLRARGLRILDIQTQSMANAPIDYPTNNVAFVGPEVEGAWVGVMAWASELCIDFLTWHLHNPMALFLSERTGIVVHLWSHRAGRAAGCGVYRGGTIAETRALGHIDDLETPLERGENLLGAVLGDAAFEFRRFMEAPGDYEMAIATLASRLGRGLILADVMDLVDGDGGIALVAGRLIPADSVGWTGIHCGEAFTLG